MMTVNRRLCPDAPEYYDHSLRRRSYAISVTKTLAVAADECLGSLEFVLISSWVIQRSIAFVMYI